MSRPAEADRRARAIFGAQLALDNPGMSKASAAAESGTSITGVQEAFFIMVNGTPEEIEAFKAGRGYFRKLAEDIRIRIPREQWRTRPGSKPRRPHEQQARSEAFRVTRLALSEGISFLQTSKREGVSLHALNDAYLILQHGTEEQIAKVESGESTLADMTALLRRSVPDEVRALKRRKPVHSHETREVRTTEVAIWSALRSALAGLVALPQPTDVAHIMRKHVARTEFIDRNLIAAFGWITEFSDEWTK